MSDLVKRLRVVISPSWTVNDQKGFYHCFSSGKHGDIFTFLMETEGLSFPEAVERVALACVNNYAKERDWSDIVKRLRALSND